MNGKAHLGAVMVVMGDRDGSPCVKLEGFPKEGISGKLLLDRKNVTNPWLAIQNWTRYQVTVRIIDIDSSIPPKAGVFAGQNPGDHILQPVGSQGNTSEVKLLTGIGAGPHGSRRWEGARICIASAVGIPICPDSACDSLRTLTYPPDVVVEC